MATMDRTPAYSRKLAANTRPADRLGIAQYLGILLLALSVAALGLIFLDSGFRSNADQDQSLRLVRALDLSNLSLVPSGKPWRYSGSLKRAFEPHVDPGLESIRLDDAGLVLNRPDSHEIPHNLSRAKTQSTPRD